MPIPGTVSSNPLGRFCCSNAVVFHTHELISFLQNHQADSLQGARLLSVKFSPLWHFALWALTTLVSLDCSSNLLTQACSRLHLRSPPHPKTWWLSQAVSNYRPYFIGRLLLRDHCLLLPDVPCIVSAFFFFFSCLDWVGKSPATPSCMETKSPSQGEPFPEPRGQRLRPEGAWCISHCSVSKTAFYYFWSKSKVFVNWIRPLFTSYGHFFLGLARSVISFFCGT